MFNKFCKDFPELAEKVDFINDVKLDTPDVTLYTSEKRVDSNGKGSNHSQEQGRSGEVLQGEHERTNSVTHVENISSRQGESGNAIENRDRTESLSTSNERGKASNGSDSKRQITKKYNPDRETYQEKLAREQSEQARGDVTHSEYVAKTTGRTSEDIIRGINSGDVVLKTVADIDSLVSQVADETADIRDWSFRTLAEQGDDKATKFLQADVPAYKKLFADGDILNT